MLPACSIAYPSMLKRIRAEHAYQLVVHRAKNKRYSHEDSSEISDLINKSSVVLTVGFTPHYAANVLAMLRTKKDLFLGRFK